jgi:hypothetical protein
MKQCLACGEELKPRPTELNYNFKRRKTCNRTCAGDHAKFTGRNCKKYGLIRSYLQRLEGLSESTR